MRVGVLHGAHVVVVHHVFRPDTAFQVLEVGAELPAHATALGKAMLAYLPEPVPEDEPLTRLTNKTLDARALAKELEDVRATGLARERDEAVLGESSLAAAISDHGGHAVGAIGVVGETRRIFPRGPAKGLAEAVADAARSVSRELGGARRPG